MIVRYCVKSKGQLLIIIPDFQLLYLWSSNVILMKLSWFKRIGFFFIPVTIAGWLILVAGIAYAVYSFIDIDSKSHSVSDTLRPFLITLLIIAAVYSLIAWLTSKSPIE